VNGLARRVLLLTLIGVLLYGVFVIYTGVGQMGASLSRFRGSAFVLALCLVSVNYGLRFLKWQYYLRLLRIRGVRLFDSLLVFLSGFVLTITPGKLGEVFKSVVLSKTHSIPVALTAPIVIADRLTDVMGIVVLILLGGATFPGGLPWALAGSCAVGLGMLLVLWQAPLLAICARIERRGGRLAELAPKLRESLASLRLLAGPTSLPLPALLSVLGWGCEGIALSVLLDGFSAQVPLSLALFFYATSTLAGALVPIPGGLGLVEGMLRQELVTLGGVEHGAATAAMILTRLATLWWAVVVGFLALFVLRLRYPAALGSEGKNAGGTSVGAKPAAGADADAGGTRMS
jgi:uncharacterized protein (TIRG00374 family)